MLGKLIGNEYKASARYYLPIYGILLLLTIVNKIFAVINPPNMEAPQVILAMAYGMVMMGVIMITLIVSVQRFYKNLLGEEGYLMFTLPVKTWQLILSKVIVAVIWSIISIIVAAVSIVVLSYSGGFADFVIRIISILKTLTTVAGGFDIFMGILYVSVIFILSVAGVYLPIYAAMSLGNLSNKNKMVISFVWYFVLSIVVQTITSFGSVFASNVGMFAFINNMGPRAATHTICLLIIAALLVYNVAHYLIAHYILKNKLNLE